MAMMIHDVQDDDQVEELLDVLIESKHICFDLETMSDRFKANGERKPNEDWHPHSRVVSASFTVRDNESWVVPLSHPAGPWSTDGWWRPVLQRLADMMTGAKLIGHNLPYDIRWVYSMTGVDLLSNMWGDTMFAQHLLDENAPKGLKPMAEDRLGVPPWADVDLGRSEEEPWENVRNYNALDTRHNWHLWWEAIYPELRKSYSLARLYGKLLVPAGRALSRMSRVGMNLDVSGLEVREWALTQSIDRRQWALWDTYVPEALQDQYGDRTVRVKADGDGVEVHCDYMPTWSAQGKFFGELMEALDVPVLERTEKTGKASWNEGVMKRITLEGDFPFVEDVLAMRHETKELTSFITPWLAMKSPEGRLHPTFKPAHVSTGRLSAADPNPQQIPSKVKHFAAVSPPGWLTVQVDYAQIELRIVADLADEQNMLQAFADGKDLHKILASKIARVPESKVTKDQRTRAKPASFGFLYGMGAERFLDYAFEEYGELFTYPEAVAVRDLFFDTWPGLLSFYDRQEREALTSGEVRTPLGRRRRLPEIRSRNRVKQSMARRQAINAPVQSYASDLMLMSIVQLDQQLDPANARLFCTVHDSLVAYVRSGTMRDFVDTVSAVMLRPEVEAFGARPLRVPLAIEFEIGPAWGKPEHVVVRSTA